MRVSFLIAGMQKCATSALHSFLCQHGEIFLPRQKELHFFDNEEMNWRRPDYDQFYHTHFADAPAHALWGEATPIYTYWQPSIERIHRYNPQMKIIVLLRDPIMRAFSHWRMEYIRNKESLPFAKAIREGRDRIKSCSERTVHNRVCSYVERGFYKPQIERLLQWFPREQVIFLSMVDLWTRQGALLNHLCDFLEIAPFETLPERKMIFSYRDDKSVPNHPDAEDIRYLRALFQEDWQQTIRLTGCRIDPEILPDGSFAVKI